ncbi:protein PHYTOCHROME KINASE SUBSTRATE 1 [Silene latifolia]|uniref:protein PHYTOCHROME KINASE SUBSTRATE 1 n=1 Tax=Silene latifolia TaxID=37657 RepID=UPI003D7701D0
MASISSPNTILPPSWLSENTDTTKEMYIHTLVKTSHSPRVKKVADNGEIDVFKADKYFNGVIVKESITGSEKYQDPVRKNLTDRAATTAKLSELNLQPKTPSIHSESSYNSQSALLRRVQGNSSRSKNNSSSKNSAFLSCYCCDKKSVELADQDKFSEPGKGNIEKALYEKPIIRTIQTNLDAAEITRLNKLKKIQLDSQEEAEEHRRKKSLEVFGSDEGSKRFSLEKRLNMLSWDAIPRSSETLSETCKDTESDASSDLFEIEGMTCSIQGSQKLSGDCTTRTSGYAPSEASIEWSVVTASVADCTGFPDSENKRSSMKPPLPVKAAVNKGGQKPRPGGMLFAGCKSQKAVRVAEDVCRSPVIKRKPDESVKMHRFSESYSTVTRFQAEAKLPGNSLRQLKTTPSNNDILYLY